MLRILLLFLFWLTLSWLALRGLSRLGKLISRSRQKSAKDPIEDAKQADVIDIE